MPRVPNFTSQDMGGANLFQAPTVSQVPNYAPEQIMQYGQGLETLGAGMQRMNQELQRQQMQLQDFNDEAASKSLEDEAWQFARQLSQNKDSGYLWTAGSAAVDRYQPTLDSFDKKLQEIAQKAKNPMQQKLLAPALQKMRDHFSGEWEKHAGREMRQNAKLQATARLERYSDMAAQNWDGWENEGNPTYGPNNYRDFRNAMRSEVRSLASLDGITEDSPAFAQMLTERMQSMHKSTIANMVQGGDPAQAQRYASKFLDVGEIDSKAYHAARPQIRAADDKAEATAYGMSLWENRQGRSGNQLMQMLPGLVANNQLRIDLVDEVRKTIKEQQDTDDAVKKEQLAADIDSARMWFREQRNAGTNPDISALRQQNPDLALRLEANGGFAEMEKLEADAKRPGGSHSPQAVAALERMRDDGKLADLDPAEFYVSYYRLLTEDQLNRWMKDIRDAKEARGKSDYKPALSEQEDAWMRFLKKRPDDRAKWEAGKAAGDSSRDKQAKQDFAKLTFNRDQFFQIVDKRVRERDSARAQSGNPAMDREERDAMVDNIIEDFEMKTVDAKTLASMEELDTFFQLPENERLEQLQNFSVTVEENGAEIDVKLVELPPVEVQAELSKMLGYQDYTSAKDIAQQWIKMGRPKSLADMERIAQERKRSMERTEQESIRSATSTVALPPMGVPMTDAIQVMERINELTPFTESVEKQGTQLTAQGYWNKKQELETIRGKYKQMLDDALPGLQPADKELYQAHVAMTERQEVATNSVMEQARRLQEQALQAVLAANNMFAQSPDDQYLADHQRKVVERQRQDKAMELLAFATKASNQRKDMLSMLEANAGEHYEEVMLATRSAFQQKPPSMEQPALDPNQNANDPEWRKMRGQQMRSGRLHALRTSNKREAAVDARIQYDRLLQASKATNNIAYEYYGRDRYEKDDFTDAERFHNLSLLKQADAMLAKAKQLDKQYGSYWTASDTAAGASEALREYERQVKAADFNRKLMGELYPHEKQGNLTPGETVHQLMGLRQSDIHKKKAEELKAKYGPFWNTKD